MHLLLDTHILLWWLADAPELTESHRSAIQDKRNSCFVSAVTIWEISIKSSLGKLEIDDTYLDIIQSQGFEELPISWRHAQAVRSLPAHHKDPFDRLLIAQAQVEGMTLLCQDAIIARYDVPVLG